MTYKKTTAILVVASVIIVIVFSVSGYYIVRAFTGTSIDENKPYPVTHILDGDTFKAKIGSHIVTVRMLGIDTPETVDPRKPVQCFGKEASDETKSLLTGKNVRLKLNPSREEKDKYGRYLAYVYLQAEPEVFINEYLLENGYAREYTYSKSVPHMFQKEFKSIENTAKEGKKGLWGKCE